MKKLVLAATMLALSFTMAFAQGGKEAAPASGEAKQTTLNWAVWDVNMTAYYDPIIKAYEAQHPNVKINMIDLGSADFMTALQTQLASGSSEFDVVTIKDIPGYNNLVKKNMLFPLNDDIKKDGVDTSLYGGITEQVSVGGNLYMLPFRSDFWVVYYNKALFDEAGVPYPTNDMTFEQYDKLARQVTHGQGAKKVYGAHYHTWRSTVQLFGILDGKHVITQPPYDYLKPYYDMVLAEQKDGICQPYATLKASSLHYSGQFQNGTVAMMNMGSWYIATLISKIKAGEADAAKNWGIVKYPHAEGVEPGTTLGTITGLSVSQGSKQKDAAWDFVKFVTGPECATVIAKTGTFPAIMNDAVVNEIAQMDGFPTDENSKEALHVAKTYLEMPLHDKAGQIETVLNQWHDAIITENVSVEEGLKKMTEEVQKVLAN